VAVLAGAVSVRSIADQIADLPASLLKALGARWCWFRRDYRHPSVSTLHDIFSRIDIEELERRIGHWLFTRAHRDPDDLLVLALDWPWTGRSCGAAWPTHVSHSASYTLPRKVPGTWSCSPRDHRTLTAVGVVRAAH
jgi:hypothetical protein